MKKNKYILYIFIGIILLYIGFIVFKNGFNNFKQDIINYNEDNSIDYKVYLKENDFFEEEYLEKDKMYITSLIDNINIDFHNELSFNKKISGKYRYGIKGVISADKTNTKDEYWKKEYIFVDEKEEEFNNINVITFDNNIIVEYQEYNDLLLEFKKTYNIQLDGNLDVILYVDYMINDEFERISTSTLTIPLTKSTIEVPIEINTINDSGVLESKIIYDTSIKYLVLKIIGIILFITGIYFILLSILFILKREESDYTKEIRKILKEYDGIIVNLHESPKMTKGTIVNVLTFNELLDAHGEVRQPINFIRHKDYSEFILINDDMVWKYKIKKEDYKNEK